MCTPQKKYGYAKGRKINHIKSYHPEPTVINIWVYMSFWISSHIKPLNKHIRWFTSTGLLICIPLLPGAPGWLHYLMCAHWFHHVAGGRSAHAFQTQTQKMPLIKGQHIWNEDSQTRAGGVVFRPVDKDQSPAQTFGFLNQMCQLTELQLWESFKAFIPCQVLVRSKNKSGTRLFFKLYTLYMCIYRQVLLVTVVMFYKVAMNTEWSNTKPLLLGEIHS